MQIDPDVSASDLIQAWLDGNHAAVIKALSNDHAGLAALVIVQGAADGRLSQSDCNAIANRLIDERVKLCTS